MVLRAFKNWALMIKCSFFIMSRQKQRFWTLSGLQPWTRVWRLHHTLCTESVSVDFLKHQTHPALLWSYSDENRSSHWFWLWNSWTVLQSSTIVCMVVDRKWACGRKRDSQPFKQKKQNRDIVIFSWSHTQFKAFVGLCIKNHVYHIVTVLWRDNFVAIPTCWDVALAVLEWQK